MNESDRILRKIVEKYKDDIIFHVSSNECMIKVLEPWTIWIQPLRYEIIEEEVEGYVQMLLKTLKDPNEPRIGTFAKKYMEIHMEH